LIVISVKSVVKVGGKLVGGLSQSMAYLQVNHSSSPDLISPQLESFLLDQ
jgi:hypothetical protein